MSQFLQAMLLGPLMSKNGGKKMGSMQEDLVYLGKLLESGKIAPVVDRRYPLSDIVEAFRYVEDTHARCSTEQQNLTTQCAAPGLLLHWLRQLRRRPDHRLSNALSIREIELV